jgi:hypothetical protein
METKQIKEQKDAYTNIEDIKLITDKVDKKLNKTQLKFANLKQIGYLFFMKESFFFILTNILHRLPILLCSVFYKLANKENYIGSNDFVIIFMDLVSSGLRDFQEVIPIVCGPFYSKGDFENYRLSRNRLIFISCIGFMFFLGLIPFLKPLFLFLGVKAQSVDDMVHISRLYIFCYASFMAISNFLKGTHNFIFNFRCYQC